MNKIATLAKIANRLDSLGLTKEADVLDSFIRKVAEMAAPASPSPATPVKDWDSYVAKTKDGLQVKNSWQAYATAANAQTDFWSFVKWWKANNKSANVQSPQQVVAYLDKMTKGINERKDNRQIEGLKGVNGEKAAEQLADQRWSQAVTEAQSSVPREAAGDFMDAYGEV